MGWWWSSAPKDEQQQQQQQASHTPPLTSSHPSPADSNPFTRDAAHPKPKTLTRDEQAEADFRSFLSDISSSTSPPSPSTDHEPRTAQPSTTSPSPPSPPPSSIAPDSLYPSTMSCRSAFDYAFFCQSLGGQWVNIYRYGELRSCSEHWGNFWLCMRTKSLPEEERKRAIRDHYRKKAVKWRTGPSSEDVWDLREEMVEGAFEGDFWALEREVEAQRERERERSG